MFYYYKSISESSAIPQGQSAIKQEWSPENFFYGIYLENNHYFNVFSSREKEIHLLAGLRATTIFDYLNFDNSPRLLPEVLLGIAVAFGRSGQKRF